MSRNYTMTTQKELRAAFWEIMPPNVVCLLNRNGNPRSQNKQPADTRMAFVDWIDCLQKDGEISEALAHRATL